VEAGRMGNLQRCQQVRVANFPRPSVLGREGTRPILKIGHSVERTPYLRTKYWAGSCSHGRREMSLGVRRLRTERGQH
jgi:hypothetical protein